MCACANYAGFTETVTFDCLKSQTEIIVDGIRHVNT